MKLPLKLTIIVLLGLAAYGNALRNGFVWDDTDAIAENYFIRQWSNAPQLLSRDYFIRAHELSYRPLVTATYFADYSLWELNPLGYHLSNLVIHLLAATAWMALAGRLTGDPTLGFVAALLFLVHPATTEAVNVIAFREDLMAGLFMFLAFLSYLRFAERRSPARWGHYVLALGFYFVGMVSKEMAATLPLVIGAREALNVLSARRRAQAALPPAPERAAKAKPSKPPPAAVPPPVAWLRPVLGRVGVYAGFGLVLGLYLLLRFVVMYNPKEETTGMLGGSLWISLLTTSRIVATYIKLMVLPVGLSAHYDFAPAKSILDTDVLLSLGLIGLCLRHVWLHARGGATTAFPVVAFFILLLPVMNVIPIVNPAAERYLYIPTAMFCLAAAVVLRRRAPTWVVPLVLVTLGGLTFCRNAAWRDNESIWSITAETHPDSADIHHELGDVHHAAGRLREAAEEYRKALAINPRHLAVHVNLGVCYDAMGEPDLALAEYQTAVQLDPSVSKIHNNIGNIHYKKGRIDQAVAAYGEAMRLNPHYPEPYNNLSTVLAAAGRFDEAARVAKQGLALAPDRPGLKLTLARVMFCQGNEAEALALCRDLITRGQVVPDVHVLQGDYYAGCGRLAEAMVEYRAVLTARPQDAVIYLRLGQLYEQTGDPAQAVSHYEQFLARWQGDPAQTAAARQSIQRLRQGE